MAVRGTLLPVIGGLTALDEVSFTAPACQVTGIIGPNGAGKPTLLNAACGLLKPIGAVGSVTPRSVPATFAV